MPSSLCGDLEVLLGDDQAVYLRLGPEGAVLSVKGRGSFAFGEAIGHRWQEMSPPERACLVLEWIRQAAAYMQAPRKRWVSGGMGS